MYVNYMKTIKNVISNWVTSPIVGFMLEKILRFTPLNKKIEECRLGLSTSGAYSLGQSAYHYKDDSSLRSIEKTVRRKIFGFLISQRTTLRTLEKIRIAFYL